MSVYYSTAYMFMSCSKDKVAYFWTLAFAADATYTFSTLESSETFLSSARRGPELKNYWSCLSSQIHTTFFLPALPPFFLFFFFMLTGFLQMVLSGLVAQVFS